MIALLLLACSSPPVALSGMEPLAAVADFSGWFQFLGMSEDEGRVLVVQVPDLLVYGETSAEADFAGTLELVTGRNLEELVTVEWVQVGGVGRCRVEDRWRAVAGTLTVTSETPFEFEAASAIAIRVDGVVLESELTSERREVDGESWSTHLGGDDIHTDRGGEVGGCVAAS